MRAVAHLERRSTILTIPERHRLLQLSAPLLTYGDRVSVTGTVGTFQGEVQISPAPTVTFLGAETVPTPVVMTIGQAKSDYENVGKFVSLSGLIATAPASGQFKLHAGTDTIIVYIDSDTGINLGAVAVGDAYTIISPLVNYTGGVMELKPRRQADLIEGSGPIIDAVNCADWTPLASDPITVTATITDDTAVTSAALYYRDDSGDSTGVFLNIPMSDQGGNVWSGTIPGGFLGRQVDFYVRALDGNGNISLNPGDAPAGWYEVAVGITSIHDVQYVDPATTLQNSPFTGRVVNVQGIVTAGTGDAGAVSKFIMQDGSGTFSGLLCYEGTAANFLLPGDEVQVGGYIEEYFGLTEMNPHNGSAIELISFENALPAYNQAHTVVLADDTSTDGYLGEAYESVLVRTFASTVIDSLGSAQYSEFMVSDTGADADSLVVNAAFDMVYSPVLGQSVIVKGFMDYAFGEFQLVPLRDEDITVVATAVEGDLPQILPAGGFSSIKPNPFNPKTEIRFVLTRDNLVQLNVYNIRGELVSTLVNERLQGGGERVVSWDGTDNAGQQMASGTYFARLRIGADVMQVRKLMLVK
ncbi:MAG: T9SS type A sorting domain-containing protein [bacterium]|nr:T9SS type A sorting domain-containing protein [bacterium]